MIESNELAAALRSVPTWAESQETAVARADAAMTAMQQLQQLSVALAGIKAMAMRDMWEQGWSFREIGEALGISGSRVEQIIKR